MIAFIKHHYSRYRRLSLGTRILIFMGVGVIAGVGLGERAILVQPVGDLFLRLLLMSAIPLVFFNLLAGLTSIADVGVLGRLGGRIMAYYLLTTTIALTLGLLSMHAIQPGVGMTLTEEVDRSFGEIPGVMDLLVNLVPRNVFQAFSDGQVAQIVVFALFLGIATLLLPAEKRAALKKGFELTAELLRKLVEVVLYFGPIGLGALAAAAVGQYGAKIFGPLALFLAGVWAAQLTMVLVYMLLLRFLSGQSPITFLRKTGPLYATTVATCSSLASLVVALDIAEKRLKLPKSIYAFTLPLGAQLNKDGTAIMLAGILLFTAQSAGVHFDMSSQITIILVGLILSEGSGGIPGGGLVIALIFVQAFHLPLEIAAIVGGIYRLIDMGSTTVNCMGDMVGTSIVSHFEAVRKP